MTVAWRMTCCIVYLCVVTWQHVPAVDWLGTLQPPVTQRQLLCGRFVVHATYHHTYPTLLSASILLLAFLLLVLLRLPLPSSTFITTLYDTR